MSFAFAIFLLHLVNNFGGLFGRLPAIRQQKKQPKFDYCQTQAQIILQNSVNEFWISVFLSGINPGIKTRVQKKNTKSAAMVNLCQHHLIQTVLVEKNI